jgi:hypothetical protein
VASTGASYPLDSASVLTVQKDVANTEMQAG